ncbi:NAD-dependent epimerase/dehydratase family protein [Prevotella communis]|uniref:NAD-dependent epimerase/dehydratase family protein n=1 Tax=Prevotella communis TaxID=2913614 RepID=UPI001EDC407F|nr:NAD-dependent epimerase/dehydratase family protein [Prevotella communis]UKK67582.1 NAD-dependent epimerase/dehydratase family protein [Prevotella communis]UKK70272.1 NAD-dependent epimerase/dehydratase family protein [Prevotella communis]
MKILITGVHGFVGSNLVKALSTEHTIYGLDIVSPTKEGIRNTFSWDYLDVEGGIPDVDAIIHLAGKAHDTKNQTVSDVYFKVNTGLTQKIFDYFLAHDSIKKFVFFSTAKAAADKVDGVLTEDIVPAPVGPYGESKIAAERYILDTLETWNLKPETPTKQVYILRPCMIHGPGNKGNLNLLYGVVKKGIPWPLGAFENRRTFTSIDNLSFVINGLLAKDVPTGIYNMGDDEALSTNELIEEICKSLGKKAHIWKLPKGLMNRVAKIGGALHLPLNSERLRKLTENYISSNAKIKAALGVEKMPVDAREGLKVTLDSFK